MLAIGARQRAGHRVERADRQTAARSTAPARPGRQLAGTASTSAPSTATGTFAQIRKYPVPDTATRQPGRPLLPSWQCDDMPERGRSMTPSRDAEFADYVAARMPS